MNKKEQKEIRRSWTLVVIGSLLAFFVGVSSSAFYNFYNNSSWKDFKIFVLFAVISIFLMDTLSLGIQNFKEFNKMSEGEFFKFWLKSRFGRFFKF